MTGPKGPPRGLFLGQGGKPRATLRLLRFLEQPQERLGAFAGSPSFIKLWNRGAVLHSPERGYYLTDLGRLWLEAANRMGW